MDNGKMMDKVDMPALERLADAVKDMDEEQVEKLVLVAEGMRLAQQMGA